MIKLFALTADKYHGIKEEKIISIEKKLNIRFPEVLRNYYLLFGRNKKFNINDKLFRIEDVYIEDNQFLVIGNSAGLNGINLNDISNKNINIYNKIWRHDKITFKSFQKWYDGHESIEVFLFRQFIYSGLDGGFRYYFTGEDDQSDELNTNQLVCKNDKIFKNKLTEIADISFENQFGATSYYTYNYEFILYTCWYNDKIDYFDFGTEDKKIYEKTIAYFEKNGINIEKKNKYYSSDFIIYKNNMPGAILEIFPNTCERKYDKNHIANREKSIFLNLNAIDKFYDLLRKINDKFDVYGTSTVFNNNQVNNLINELSDRLYKMQNERNFHYIDRKGNYDYYSQNNVEFRRYKRQIIKLLTDLIEWLKKYKEKTITIYGI